MLWCLKLFPPSFERGIVEVTQIHPTIFAVLLVILSQTLSKNQQYIHHRFGITKIKCVKINVVWLCCVVYCFKFVRGFPQQVMLHDLQQHGFSTVMVSPHSLHSNLSPLLFATITPHQ
jgi:hypothetical protein